jgi:hypothetical protein
MPLIPQTPKNIDYMNMYPWFIDSLNRKFFDIIFSLLISSSSIFLLDKLYHLTNKDTFAFQHQL